ncbi:ISAzo13-like element transposase-related protein [Desulfonema magnum]|uniref:Transposase DDE domain-containing protein n=1 Tax=Desulfonema magnum TaxID=45655 RepID=A0A975BM17_9BACT|nr:hypothetical protein [Desulfonema magnum]QTA87936.1 Transposase DDE domain-containing protein [Desulfonema magnum]
MQPYSLEVEEIMRRYYESLNEKDRRRYAGIEALKLGHGGQNYIAKVLGCSRRTVRKGAIEVSGLPGHIVAKQIGKSPAESSEIRKKGGGRKQYLTEHPEIDEQFLNVVREHTAGDPMDEKVRWTNLREWEIAEALEKKYGVKVSRNIVRQLLKKHDYRLRSLPYTFYNNLILFYKLYVTQVPFMIDD